MKLGGDSADNTTDEDAKLLMMVRRDVAIRRMHQILALIAGVAVGFFMFALLAGGGGDFETPAAVPPPSSPRHAAASNVKHLSSSSSDAAIYAHLVGDDRSNAAAAVSHASSSSPTKPTKSPSAAAAPPPLGSYYGTRELGEQCLHDTECQSYTCESLDPFADQVVFDDRPNQDRFCKPHRPRLVMTHWNGRFGNRMHQYAYGREVSERLGYRFEILSKWEGDKLFWTPAEQAAWERAHPEHVTTTTMHPARIRIIDDADLLEDLLSTKKDYNKGEMTRAQKLEKYSKRTGDDVIFVSDPVQIRVKTSMVHGQPHGLEMEDLRYNDTSRSNNFPFGLPRELRSEQHGKSWGSPDVAFDSMCAYDSEFFYHFRSAERVASWFHFSDRVRALPVFRKWQAKAGTYDVAHLRRNDIAKESYGGGQGYSVVSLRSYYRAFETAGVDPKDVVWVTDDRSMRWTSKIFGGEQAAREYLAAQRKAAEIRHKPKWKYPEGEISGLCGDEDPHCVNLLFLEDMLKLYFARRIFRANSSFSWWAAFLAYMHRRGEVEVWSPVLHTKNLYGGHHGGIGATHTTTDFEYIRSTGPHWMCEKFQHNCGDIVFGADAYDPRNLFCPEANHRNRAACTEETVIMHEKLKVAAKETWEKTLEYVDDE